MDVMLRLPHLTGVLLLAVTPYAAAESPMPDPIAPAVIGRPLDQLRPARPARPARQKPAAGKPIRPAPVASVKKAVPASPSAPVAFAPIAVQEGAASQRAAKQALDDRADPRAEMSSDVGKGTHFARKPLGAGAYFSSQHEAMVRKYYQAHPVSGPVASWKIGEPVPRTAALTGVPDELRATLPALPPGHQYVQLNGEVVLVAVQSRMVVDGVSRTVR